ncbi:MAG: tetraacyldisaccharide 4'-kinase [Nitrospirae bacterium]|nr:tetraacyldisaccharide 4'-kinase [Nitrospirota bacterium]
MNILEYIYYCGYSLKKKRLLAAQKRLPYPVVSIGNLTLGGTGKTPAAIALAAEALKRGYQPVVLTRGYRGRAKGPCFVTRCKDDLLDISCCDRVKDSGDEPMLIASKLPDVYVVKSADRYKGGLFFLENYRSVAISHKPLFILDDGFQHWRLYRDIDIVLVDGRRGFGNTRMLPLGPMRGPFSELAEADFFVLTKTLNNKIEDELKSINPDAPVFASEYAMGAVENKNRYQLSRDDMKKMQVFAFCGLADPESFRSSVSSLCPNITSFIQFRDHYLYTQKDVERILKQASASGADAVITTNKDMVKLLELDIPNYIFSLGIDFSVSTDFYEKIFSRINI